MLLCWGHYRRYYKTKGTTAPSHVAAAVSYAQDRTLQRACSSTIDAQCEIRNTVSSTFSTASCGVGLDLMSDGLIDGTPAMC